MIDNKFVRHAVELTALTDKAVDSFGIALLHEKARVVYRSCPPVCLSAVLLYVLASRLFPPRSLVHTTAKVPLITALSLVGVKGTDDAAQEKESSSRLSSRFPLNFDSAFFCWRSGPRETTRRASAPH